MKSTGSLLALLTLFISMFPAYGAPPSGNSDSAVALQKTFDAWNERIEPFQIAGNLYFVGMRNISSFLFTGPEGHVLIDTGFAKSVPIIQSNIIQLGFAPREIKYILSSHAHADHLAGHAAMKRITGAKIVISEWDAPLLRSGGREDFLFANEPLLHFEPCEPDVLVHEGNQITLGKIELTAHLTPGHTPGCTSWTTRVSEDGRELDVVLFGSTSINPGTLLVRNVRYPDIARDLQHTYEKLGTLRCDIFLAPHPEQFQMEEKLRRPRGGRNRFIDPEGYRSYLAEKERAFHEELERQQTESDRKLQQRN